MAKSSKGGCSPVDTEIIKDPRFSKVHYDPRFKKISTKDSKVKIDSRFSNRLKSDQFLEEDVKTIVDKYGRFRKQGGLKEKLDRYYRLETPKERVISDVVDHIGRKGYDQARGIDLESSSDDESESLNTECEDLYQYGPYTECSTTSMDRITNRLAIVDLDWDNINAAAIYKILNTFVPKDGDLKSVKIYVSEFGKLRLAEEDLEGPPREIFLPNSDESPRHGDEPQRLFEENDVEIFDQVKLRKYLLERLRYFYCVAEFDSSKTAKIVYDECNGLEFEHSSNIINMRCIPDKMLFQDDPASFADKNSTTSTENHDFVTGSMQLSKPRLTWDEDDNNLHIVKRRFTDDDLERMDLKAYLASPSASDCSDNDCENPDSEKISKKQRVREKYLRLISESSGDHDVYQKPRGSDIKVTFKPIIELDSVVDEHEFRDGSSRGSDISSHQLISPSKSPPVNELLDDMCINTESDDRPRKEKLTKLSPLKNAKNRSSSTNCTKAKVSAEERKAIRKQRDELELLIMDDSNIENFQNREHFSAKQVIKYEKLLKLKGKIKNKTKKVVDTTEIQSSFKIDTADERFVNFYKDADYAIDPTCPRYKPTNSTLALLADRRKILGEPNAPTENLAPSHSPTDTCVDTSKTSVDKLLKSLKKKINTPNKPKRAPLSEINEKSSHSRKVRIIST